MGEEGGEAGGMETQGRAKPSLLGPGAQALPAWEGMDGVIAGALPRGSEPVYGSDGGQHSLAAVPSRVILNFNTSIAHPPLLIAVADLLFM